MGVYTWLSEPEFNLYSKVNDKEVNAALQEVRALMPEWYISETETIRSKWFSNNVTHITYDVYYRLRPNDTEVRYQVSARKKETVLNFLYGLYMGYHANINKG